MNIKQNAPKSAQCVTPKMDESTEAEVTGLRSEGSAARSVWAPAAAVLLTSAGSISVVPSSVDTSKVAVRIHQEVDPHLCVTDPYASGCGRFRVDPAEWGLEPAQVAAWAEEVKRQIALGRFDMDTLLQAPAAIFGGTTRIWSIQALADAGFTSDHLSGPRGEALEFRLGAEDHLEHRPAGTQEEWTIFDELESIGEPWFQDRGALQAFLLEQRAKAAPDFQFTIHKDQKTGSYMEVDQCNTISAVKHRVGEKWDVRTAASTIETVENETAARALMLKEADDLIQEGIDIAEGRDQTAEF